MSDIENIILTACATLIGGILLLIVSELFKVLVIVPVQKTREQIQVVLSQIDFYSNRLTNFFSAEPTEHDIDIIKSITQDLRKVATDLQSKYELVYMKKPLVLLKVLPSQERIDIAFTGLMFLHSSILYEGWRDYIVNLIEMNENRIERVKAA
ncbi:hypothetical protein EUA76_02580, partial [TM7 phylum sp. oral taxon 350]